MLTLKDNIITLDAMECQKDIVQAIVEQPVDYVFTVKGNHPNLRYHIEERFAFAQDECFRSCRHIHYAKNLNQCTFYALI